MREAYPNSAERTRAVALVSIGMALGFGIGPVIGGILIEAIGWRSIFAVNLVASVVVVAIVRIHVPPSVPRAVRVPGLLGVALGVVTLATLTFALIEGGNAGWASRSVLAAAARGRHGWRRLRRLQRTGASRCCRGGCSAQREVSVVAVLGLLFNFTAYAQMFVLALYFQREWGYTPLQNALMFLPAAVRRRSSPRCFVGRLAARVGPRALLALGLAGNALAPRHPHVQRTATAGSSSRWSALLIAGVAGGLAVPGLNIVVAVSSPPDLVGVGTAVLNALRQVGGVLGIAILGSMIGDGTDDGRGARRAALVGRRGAPRAALRPRRARRRAARPLRGRGASGPSGPRHAELEAA